MFSVTTQEPWLFEDLMWLVQLIGASIDQCHADTVQETDTVVTTGQEEHYWGTKEDPYVLFCCSGRVLNVESGHEETILHSPTGCQG